MFRELLIYISAYVGLFAVTFYTLSLIRKSKKHPEFPEKNPPKVSIVIPAFNEEKGIETTIKSALSLDYPKDKLEIIIVDDGSIDNTYKVASKIISKNLRVFKLKKNQGKGVAMNSGIRKARGEIIVTMDADNTHVEKNALKNMIAYFNNPKVMCVAPAMAVYNPKGILQRVQQIEYLLGVFLRKAFSTAKAVHITPGAFSAYRKSFFTKYGKFDENNLTEDLEMALRIQSKHYLIENSLKAVVFTTTPRKFKPLLAQRKRWYIGLIKNLWHYRKLFSFKYGDLGLIVLPTAIITIVISTILTSYLVINSIWKLQKELALLESINFNILSSIEFNKYLIERYIFLITSNPIAVLAAIFILILIGYMVFAKKYVKEHSKVKLSIILFLIFYSLLFAFWWIISFIYVLIQRKISWR